MIYADHAATTKLDIDAFNAMKEFLTDEFGNISQPYSLNKKSKEAIKNAREIIANCINAEPSEIIFTSGGSESDNFAIKGLASTYYNKAGIVTSAIEHHAVLNTCRSLSKLGCEINVLPTGNNGIVKINSLQDALKDNVKLVTIMLVNNEIGTIEPVKALAEISHDKNALFHTDAVQAVGHIPIDVKYLNVDMLSASAHKFGGPKGIGFLYKKNGVNIAPLIDGGAQEFHMRAGTENVASIVGMAAALEKSCRHMYETKEYLKELENSFITRLKYHNLDFVINGGENKVPGNISLSIRNANGEMLLHRLDLMNIYVSTGSACNGNNTELSHVLNAINLPLEYAHGTIRVSLGYDNTVDDVIKIADSINKIISC